MSDISLLVLNTVHDTHLIGSAQKNYNRKRERSIYLSRPETHSQNMSTKIFITVEKGDPLDYMEYRHTALHLIFPDATQSVMHVVGTHGMFNFQERENYDPSTSPLYVKSTPVADIPEAIGPALIKLIILMTPVKNKPEDMPWNCQNWVADALSRLMTYGYLTEAERERGIDEMVTACFEAEDEENRPAF
ncbi:hypothetical protein DTO166G4_8630 [Paecilomyces variotii]|nr:hypothetical protein DTO164E3_3989 [Paecilomyces variotii]KAJ9208219.1 hypothetical protein DTO032I3_890 [Paecilomyces variotii]KAJ9209778.1 hypothetical protein DTO166G4_8630 [Paecilomyces variotii]KAJ9228430.1 hypothetical protein DTO166G5_8585 [Paecilomyces variotii]KAJ9237378.1 hypothetical protein DTO169E5_5274 [Paecilomyces variotii]